MLITILINLMAEWMGDRDELTGKRGLTGLNSIRLAKGRGVWREWMGNAW